jgi:hypothetical protein
MTDTPAFSVPHTPDTYAMSDMMEQHIAGFYANLNLAAWTAQGKLAKDLTNEERFAIAVLAGARILTFSPPDASGKCTATTEKCSITEDGKGGFNVYVFSGNDKVTP